MREHDKGRRRLSPEGRIDYSNYRFNEITAASVHTITEDALSRSGDLLEQIVGAQDLSYNNVLGRLSEIKDILGLADGKAGFMGHVHTDSEVRDAGFEAEERITKFSTKLVFNESLYAKVKAFSKTAEANNLEGEKARLLQKTLDRFSKAGHDLDPEKRARLQELNLGLDEMGTEFQRNISSDKTVISASSKDLAGLPESFVEGLEKDEEGNYKITMAYPHVIPVLTHADNRDLRRQVSHAFSSRAKESNRELLEKTVAARQEIAEILGKQSWAHHKLGSDRMAKSPEEVFALYDSVLEPLTGKAKEEITKMQGMLEADGYDDQLRTYDVAYYTNKIRQQEYGVDSEKVAEYLPLDNVLEGMFTITGSTFGLKYRKLDDIPTWHPDVMAFAIDDSETGQEISMFYMDLFPREGKYNHAAAFTLKAGRELPDGDYRRPESSIVANFTKPTSDKPSLLKQTEVKTLFHEFGHILHQTLTKAKIAELSGTSVERDFVEAPSQIMEHWTEEAEVLQSFAKHYKTGEPIPTELVSKMLEGKNLNIGHATLRQIQFGLLDMALHDESQPKDLDEITKKAFAVTHLPYEEGTFFPASFGHILGGYDAGYYGYLWSEVYGDDMFERFRTEGLTNPQIGGEYRQKILERGGTMDAIDMLRDFLGREPNSQAFLRNLGIEQDQTTKTQEDTETSKVIFTKSKPKPNK